jgi:hypothetical protein
VVEVKHNIVTPEYVRLFIDGVDVTSYATKDPTRSTTDQRAKGRSVSPQGSTVPGWIACDRLVGADPTALRSWRPTVGPLPSTDRDQLIEPAGVEESEEGLPCFLDRLAL